MIVAIIGTAISAPGMPQTNHQNVMPTKSATVLRLSRLPTIIGVRRFPSTRFSPKKTSGGTMAWPSVSNETTDASAMMPTVAVVAPEALPPCDVLELDCEGAEVEILSTMTIRPRVILTETHGLYGAPTPRVVELLGKIGYRTDVLGVAEPRLRAFVPEGGNVVFPRLPPGVGSDMLAEHLVREYSTLVVPGRFFESPRHIRFSFGTSGAHLARGLRNLTRALDDLIEVGRGFSRS